MASKGSYMQTLKDLTDKLNNEGDQPLAPLVKKYLEQIVNDANSDKRIDSNRPVG